MELLPGLAQMAPACTTVFPQPEPEYLDWSPEKLALTLLYDLGTALETAPALLPSPGGDVVPILFRGSCLLCEELLDLAKTRVALLSKSWPAVLCGTVEGLKLGEIRAEALEEGIRVTKYSVSRKDFDVLSDLLVRLEVREPEQKLFLSEAVFQIKPRRTYLAVRRRFEKRALEAGLAPDADGSLFCYLPLTGEPEPADRLKCLTYLQREELWRTYLEQGVSPAEFDWLLSAFEAGQGAGMLEWELALQSAMARLKVSYELNQGTFQVFKDCGRKLRLDYPTAPAAGKLFLHMFFPV